MDDLLASWTCLRVHIDDLLRSRCCHHRCRRLPHTMHTYLYKISDDFAEMYLYYTIRSHCVWSWASSLPSVVLVHKTHTTHSFHDMCVTVTHTTHENRSTIFFPSSAVLHRNGQPRNLEKLLLEPFSEIEARSVNLVLILRLGAPPARSNYSTCHWRSCSSREPSCSHPRRKGRTVRSVNERH